MNNTQENDTHNSVEVTLLDNIGDELNAHLRGFKRVFLGNDDTPSALTQFAYGFMNTDDESGVHVHKTMDEYFFFIKGEGVLEAEEKNFELKPNTFLRIPAGTHHNLINKNKQVLEFVYFGVAL